MDRRKFLQQLGIVGSTFALNLNGVYVNAKPNILNLAGLGKTEKILVLLQLFGGNDGLNTLIPFEDDIYHKNRPNLRVKKEKVLKINSLAGFHPEMSAFHNLYNNGKINIIQNVGYENPNRSHFRSTDIWKSASDENEYVYNGWTGRYLNQEYADIVQNPEYPLAIELGWAGSMLIENNNIPLGIYMASPENYYSLNNGGLIEGQETLSPKANDALKYINDISRKSHKFSNVIKVAAEKGRNSTSYPDTFLGKQLSITAKLISGGLPTSVYITKLKGFDTHYNQLGTHDNLLKHVSDAVSAFQADIESLGISDRVSLLIFSEFGRRVGENSTGTDHGTAAPIFVVGDSVRAGVIGRNPNLGDLDENGDLKYKYDFRQVYSTILQDHLGATLEETNSVLNNSFSTLPIYRNSIESFPDTLASLKQNYPNPVTDKTTIEYSLYELNHIKLSILNLNGVLIKTLVDSKQSAGKYTVIFSPLGLLSTGIYFYQLSIGELRITKRFIVSNR